MPDAARLASIARQTTVFNLNAIERAIEDFGNKQEPTEVDELELKGMTLYYGGFLKESRAYMNALVSIEPTERWLIKLAQIEAKSGDVSRALTVLERALSLFPGSYQAWELQAVCLLALDRRQEAREAAERALEIQPNGERPTAVLRIVHGGREDSTHGGPFELAVATHIASNEDDILDTTLDVGQFMLAAEPL